MFLLSIDEIYQKEKHLGTGACYNVIYAERHCLMFKNGETCQIPIQNNQTYLQVLELKDIKSWKALDEDGSPILD
ncbi:MAG: hypothetical protein HFH62_00420 [Lachnospiraceae bacterium]|nr:hypothetical protein [Lachnospiraceae bacterium]